MCLNSKYIVLSCLTVLLSLSTLHSQNFVDEEVEALAKELASKLDGKNQFLKPKKRIQAIVIEDFTDTENKVSKLGASLSEELSLALANAAMSFKVTTARDYEKSRKSGGGFNSTKLLNGLSKMVDGAIDDRNHEKSRQSREALKALDGANDVGSTITQKRKIYKGMDAAVTGTLTESNDQYRILVKVISQEKGNPIVVSVKGFVSKTPFILALEEEENRRKVNTTVPGAALTPRGISSSSSYSGAPFTSNHTKVELLEARQVGQSIECRFRITNTGADVNFNIYGKNSGGKIIDSNNSFDYWVTQVEMGELMNNSYVQKTLVTNNPVEAKVTFGGVARAVSKIAKLSVKCYGHGGHFWIEFRDVYVD